LRKEAILPLVIFLTLFLNLFSAYAVDIGVDVATTTSTTTTTTIPTTTTTLPVTPPARLVMGIIPFVIGLGAFVKIAMFAVGGTTPEEMIRKLILAIIIVSVSVFFIGAMASL
jgi:hypothetical protein